MGILRAVIVTCRYSVSTAHLRQQFFSLQDAIENALATVVLGQAILRVGIAGEDTKEPAFVHLKTIDMDRMIEWEKTTMPVSAPDKQTEAGGDGRGKKEQDEAHCDDDLLRSLKKHHEALWEDLASKPGWKIVVRHDPRQLSGLQSRENDMLLSLDISFCFHHAYSDGRGAYIFHGDLQRALNSGARPPELQDHTLHLPTPPALPPAMETLIPFTLSWAFVLRTVWTELLYPVFVPPLFRRLLRLEPSAADVPWTGAPVDGSNPKMHLRTLFAADEAQLQRILARCRAHGASLTGLLNGLVARSLARLVEGRSFRSITIIALASHADSAFAGAGAFTAGETIHCLVTSLSCAHGVDAVQQLRRRDEGAGEARACDDGDDEGDDDDDATVWGFARDMTAQLRAKVASLPRDDILGLSGLIGDWHAFFRVKFGKARESTWEMSNLGSLSAVDAGAIASKPDDSLQMGGEKGVGEGRRWLIDRAIFTQGGNATSAAMSVNVAGVTGHGIYVTVSWQDGIVNAELVDELARDLRACVIDHGQA